MLGLGGVGWVARGVGVHSIRKFLPSFNLFSFFFCRSMVCYDGDTCII